MEVDFLVVDTVVCGTECFGAALIRAEACTGQIYITSAFTFLPIKYAYSHTIRTVEYRCMVCGDLQSAVKLSMRSNKKQM